MPPPSSYAASPRYPKDCVPRPPDDCPLMSGGTIKEFMSSIKIDNDAMTVSATDCCGQNYTFYTVPCAETHMDIIMPKK